MYDQIAAEHEYEEWCRITEPYTRPTIVPRAHDMKGVTTMNFKLIEALMCELSKDSGIDAYERGEFIYSVKVSNSLRSGGQDAEIFMQWPRLLSWVRAQEEPVKWRTSLLADALIVYADTSKHITGSSLLGLGELHKLVGHDDNNNLLELWRELKEIEHL